MFTTLKQYAIGAVVLMFAGCPSSAQTPTATPATSATYEQATAAASATPTYFRVGGGVSPPTVLKSVNPEYTDEARKANLKGVVWVWVVVGSDGLVKEAKVERSLGMGLDEQALKAVKQWKFKPAHKKDGTPVAVQVVIEVNFRR